MLWTAPSAKLLVNSPAVQVIRWAQAQFPAILPGGVVDSKAADLTTPKATASSGGAMRHAIMLEGVTKRYGSVEAVRDASFALTPGATALVGHNGAGKTTLMKLMLGLIRPTSGAISVLGENPAAGQFEARRRLGYLPENVSFNAALTGRETLAFYARLKREPVARSMELLDRVGLGAAGARRVGTYSKGMRQRLGLAQALLGEPQVLLLDEPTTGLDPALRLSFYEIVQDLAQRGATVLLSSHALSELEERAERVIIMDRGRVVGRRFRRRTTEDRAPACAVPRASQGAAHKSAAGCRSGPDCWGRMA